ncbi:hypothetical protein SY85_13130 [Flavisolibacter tropicus]|uniref:Uncharacterized protein n=1 Tax=Flavisolibacter tropicus TaxID=1492898 RepID=A0A172TWR0_9BACT|nr:hypothetical protein SY85_13130 [Flavisolibacter tropicus]
MRAFSALIITILFYGRCMLIGGISEDGGRSSECRRQVEGFICAVGTDLPTEEVQKRYRLGTRDPQTREGLAREWSVVSGE